MKHIILSNSWVFTEKPFPAYRCNPAIVQHKKNERDFLSIRVVKSVVPKTWYTVTINHGNTTLYHGTDKKLAEKAKSDYDKVQREKMSDSARWIPTAYLFSSLPILPNGEFGVVKDSRGNVLIVPEQKENSDSCLLFIGHTSSFRGASLLTTGTIVKSDFVSVAGRCRAESVVILEPMQSVMFRNLEQSDNGTRFVLHSWDGASIESERVLG